jgi:hypothetical protein
VLFRPLIEIDALLALTLEMPAELEVSRDGAWPPELPEALQREARTRPPWQLPPASPLMMRNAWCTSLLSEPVFVAA